MCQIERELEGLIPDIYRFFRYYCRLEEALVDDLTQEAFLECLRCLNSFRGRSSLKTWVFAICRRRVHAHLTTTNRTLVECREEVLPQLETPEELFSSAEHISVLRNLIETQLDPMYREVLYLRYLEELSIKQISKLLDLSDNTVKTRLRRATKQVRLLWPDKEDS